MARIYACGLDGSAFPFRKEWDCNQQGGSRKTTEIIGFYKFFYDFVSLLNQWVMHPNASQWRKEQNEGCDYEYNPFEEG